MAIGQCVIFVRSVELKRGCLKQGEKGGVMVRLSWWDWLTAVRELRARKDKSKFASNWILTSCQPHWEKLKKEQKLKQNKTKQSEKKEDRKNEWKKQKKKKVSKKKEKREAVKQTDN